MPCDLQKSWCGRCRRLVACLGLSLSLGLGLLSGTASAHSHPVGLAPDDPLTADLRFCDAVVAVALQALADRERGQPLRQVAPETAGADLQNEVARHVHAEPQIRSQKFAMAYARGRCSEWLHARRAAAPDAR